MKLSKLRIVNFRCYDDATIECGSMHAIVGGNSAGKSTLVHALDFLFNPSAAKIKIDSFHRRNVGAELRVEGVFVDLTNEEKESFKGYLRLDSSFHLARTAKWEGSAEGGGAEISQSYNNPQPKFDWLNPEKINGEEIKKWIGMTLTANGRSFNEFVKGEKPTVALWKEKAAVFADMYLGPNDYADAWADNPKGFTGVLKGNLPHFDFVPAVRDVGDEAKSGKTNPFGKLIHSILDKLDPALKQDMETTFATATKRLNRDAGDQRVSAIADVEGRLRDYVRDVFAADVELEFAPPRVETILSTPTIVVNDGFRGPVEYKGHGLQRLIIMSILRAYSDLVTRREVGDRRTLILAVEEPELYMHPPMLRSVRKILRKVADGGDQVFFTTHNPLMVDVGYFDEIIRVEGPANGKGARIHQLPMAAMIEDVEARWGKTVTEASMRERYAHAYTSTRSEGFFAKLVILVEGQTELYSLPIYGAGLGYDFDAMGVVVVECGTKDQMDRLYRVFNELGIPCYVLFDYDLGGESEAKSKEILQWLNIKDDTPSAAVVGEQVAYFKENWESDLMSEIPDYEKLAGEATKALGLPSGGGKPLRARYIAQKLVQRDLAFISPTIKAIIEHALAARHSGTCLKKKPEVEARAERAPSDVRGTEAEVPAESVPAMAIPGPSSDD